MLIARIIGDCPKCKGIKTFGNVIVGGHQLDAEKRIAQAAHDQLLASPFSSLHEEEAALLAEREELKFPSAE